MHIPDVKIVCVVYKRWVDNLTSGNTKKISYGFIGERVDKEKGILKMVLEHLFVNKIQLFNSNFNRTTLFKHCKLNIKLANFNRKIYIFASLMDLY